ncbi:hypothetical protein [Thalassomonas haliotis]|uniref:Uncharacterized protein n=1 Tax=Thalassomonas haliotis TaxID=485448 RepID=A0ABY7VM29_9GAMM|nr:hypothetical protein [Thalassomonas haliotis]WDE14242.1 hypothetical protein H3N35_12970 [Thalassomonas haliotis]
MILKKAILSVLSAGLFVCSANAVQAPLAKAVTDAPAQLAAIKNCPIYTLHPDYTYEWRVGADGCRYPVLISKG